MATLHDVKAVWRDVGFVAEMFGGTAEFEAENQRRLKDIGCTLLRDLGLSAEEGRGLPPKTVLTPAAEARFEEWKSFLRTQHPDFANL